MNYLQLLKKHPRYIAYGFMHYFFSGFGQTFFISLYVPYFIIQTEIDNLTFSGIYSGATLMSAMVLPTVGHLLDRLKLRHFSVALGIVYILVCCLAASVLNVYMLFFALFGLRLCGQGLMTLTGSTAIARYFEETRGKALSLVGMGVSLSEFIMPLVVITLLGWLTWQTTWLLWAGALLIVFIPLALGLVPSNNPFQFNLEKEREKASPEGTKSSSRSQVLRHPIFYALLAVYLFMPFFSTGIVINKDLFGAANGWSQEILAIGLSVFGITRLIGNFISGPLIDKFTALRVFSFMLLPVGFGIFAMLLTSHPVAWIILFVMGGFTASVSGLASTAVWAEIYGTVHLGAIRSMVTTFMAFSTAVAPIVFSWALRDTGNYFLVLSVCLGAVLFLTGLGFWAVRRVGKS